MAFVTNMRYGHTMMITLMSMNIVMVIIWAQIKAASLSSLVQGAGQGTKTGKFAENFERGVVG